MDTISKSKDEITLPLHSFANRMFISVVSIFLLLAISFVVLQYRRESDYRIDILNNRLQVVNYQAESVWRDTAFVVPPSPERCRLTVLDLQGRVLYDNEMDAVTMGNHLDRKEVRQALEKGSGYDIQRGSASMVGEMFFYSATLFRDKGIIIRSAQPYNSQLYDDLAIDKTFIYFIVAITVLLCVVLYSIAKRLAQTERQRVENEKQQLKRQLTQNAAHELKTPTASISAYLETLLTSDNLSDEQRRTFLERSFAQCQRITSILSDMSALAQMDAVQQVSERAPINIRQLVENVTGDVHLALNEAQMTLVNNVVDATVLGDRSLVYSIFRNLIDNAIAYAGQGRKITVSATPLNAQVVEL
ncbi:MAG: hypothetical protein HUK03_02210, partial [Bacteroidaceae bacterium]|nr:hypothetical protein [Bacteroidaceae bacterium]